MNLSQLYYFRKLAQVGYFNRAAKELFITQPALSTSISSLEKELGVVLFERSKNGVHLTEDGQEFNNHIAVALSEVDRAVSAMADRAENKSTVRIATTESVQRNQLPEFLNAFRQSYDAPVDFDISVTNTQESLTGLRERAFDVAFCTYVPDLPDMETMQFTTQDVVAAVNENNPLAANDVITLEDLREHDGNLISYNQASSQFTYRLFEGLFRDYDLTFKQRFANEIGAMSLLLSDEKSVALMLDVVEDIPFPGTKTLPIKEFDGMFHLVSMTYRKTAALDQTTRAFVRFAKEQLAERDFGTPIEEKYLKGQEN